MTEIGRHQSEVSRVECFNVVPILRRAHQEDCNEAVLGFVVLGPIQYIRKEEKERHVLDCRS